MTKETAEQLAIEIVNTAVKRGFVFDPKQQRIDKVSMTYGQVAIYFGKRYSHRRNDMAASLYSLRYLLMNHRFAKALFKAEWQEALKQMVLMEELADQLKYAKLFL